MVAIPFKTFLSDIKIAHTLFALPFALLASLAAARTNWPAWSVWPLILLCMFGARTWAMTINRLADAQFDAQNPRTQNRALPRGAIGNGQMRIFATLSALLFILGAALLSRTALWCSLPVLAILASYSFAKRVTWLCHFWLGLCLGLAPLGAWVALTGTLSPGVLALAAAITFWVGGFDIVYALQDEDFDRQASLYSLPAIFGTNVSMRVSQVSHLIALGLFGVSGALLGFGLPYFLGLLIATGLIISQHILIIKRGIIAIPTAFFSLNAWLAVLLFVATAVDVTLQTVGK